MRRDTDQARFCRIYEASCGLVAELEHGRIVGLRPNKDQIGTDGLAWGHQHARGLGVASQLSGANVNLLAADGPDAVELVSGMAHLSGIGH